MSEQNAEKPGPDDERLVEQTLAGDDGAFAELVRRHKRKVFGMAARFGRESQQIEDIAQETFIRAFRNLRKFRGDAPFEHWLSRIAVRACYDFLRRFRRIRHEVPIEEFHEGAGREPGRELSGDSTEAREILDLAMARLSAEERLILTLMELEEKSVRDTALLTGWSEANVKVRAHRARQALKMAVERLGLMR